MLVVGIVFCYLLSVLLLLPAGLMETLCEHIRRLNNKLDGETLEQSVKVPAAKKKVRLASSSLISFGITESFLTSLINITSNYIIFSHYANISCDHRIFSYFGFHGV